MTVIIGLVAHIQISGITLRNKIKKFKYIILQVFKITKHKLLFINSLYLILKIF